ncbi:MAG TPA: hypothetical protein VMI33_21275 [Streptosporangiaceae bacterium]|nr:hypothetical protein [Streptosporangiaceae bacterium]
MRPRQPHRAHQEQQGQEDPEQPGPDLALQQRDRGQGEQRRQRQQQAGQGRPVPAEPQVVRHIADPGRRDAEQQQRGHPGGDEHGVDGDPAGAGPVDVAQVQDQRELVQDQRRADAEQRGRPGPPARRVQRQGEPGHAARDHEHHAEHHVVQVRVAAGDVPRPPADLGPDQPDRHPDEAETDQEGDEEAEQREPSGVHDLGREPARRAAGQQRNGTAHPP